MKTKDAVSIAVLVVLLGVGLVGVYQRLAFGHTLTSYGSYAPWGLWVASYIYFVGISAGAFILSTFYYVFNEKRLERVARLALVTTLVTLVMGLLTIWMDIGHVGRFWEIFLRPNPTSMMAWMVWLYSMFFLIVLAQFVLVVRADLSKKPLPELVLKRDQTVIKTLGAAGIPIVVAFEYGGAGPLFAVLGARPYWHTAVLPLMFLLSAILSGAALLTVMTSVWLRDEGVRNGAISLMSRIVLLSLFVYILFEWSEILVAYFTGISGAFPVELESIRLVLFGPYWWVFWVGTLLLGSLIPIVILVRWSKDHAMVGVAALLITLSLFGTRVNLIIPGVVTAELRGLATAYIDRRLVFHYVPSLHEWLLIIFVLGVGGSLLYAALKKMPILKQPPVGETI